MIGVYSHLAIPVWPSASDSRLECNVPASVEISIIYKSKIDAMNAICWLDYCRRFHNLFRISISIDSAN